MARRQHRGVKRKAQSAVWLGFLALALQVLVPFFLDADLASAAERANSADTIVICSVYGTKTVLAPDQGGNHHRHGLLNGCPVCTALAAGQSIPLTEPPTLSLPQAEAIAALPKAAISRASQFSVAFYRSRAPPPSPEVTRL